MTLAAENGLAGQLRVALDIGGTFTDVVAYDIDRGTYTVGKASSTPGDLSRGVLNALATIDAEPALCSFTVHGTTQGLNAFLQRRGERVLLLATAGAGDVYHLARGNRTRLYDIHFRKADPARSARRHRRGWRPSELCR